jgi:hypothetical protein
MLKLALLTRQTTALWFTANLRYSAKNDPKMLDEALERALWASKFINVIRKGGL